MSFIDIMIKFGNFDFNRYFNSVTKKEVKESLLKTDLNYYDLLNLLSDPAEIFLEEMAQKSAKLTKTLVSTRV